MTQTSPRAQGRCVAAALAGLLALNGGCVARPATTNDPPEPEEGRDAVVDANQPAPALDAAGRDATRATPQDAGASLQPDSRLLERDGPPVVPNLDAAGDDGAVDAGVAAADSGAPDAQPLDAAAPDLSAADALPQDGVVPDLDAAPVDGPPPRGDAGRPVYVDIQLRFECGGGIAGCHRTHYDIVDRVLEVRRFGGRAAHCAAPLTDEQLATVLAAAAAQDWTGVSGEYRPPPGVVVADAMYFRFAMQLDTAEGDPLLVFAEWCDALCGARRPFEVVFPFLDAIAPVGEEVLATCEE